MSRKDFALFPCLNNLASKNIQIADLEIYCTYLDNVKHDMNIRFKDVKGLVKPDSVINPYNVDISTVPSHL